MSRSNHSHKGSYRPIWRWDVWDLDNRRLKTLKKKSLKIDAIKHEKIIEGI